LVLVEMRQRLGGAHKHNLHAPVAGLLRWSSRRRNGQLPGATTARDQVEIAHSYSALQIEAHSLSSFFTEALQKSRFAFFPHGVHVVVSHDDHLSDRSNSGSTGPAPCDFGGDRG
jgi:hypothetical protein